MEHKFSLAFISVIHHTQQSTVMSYTCMASYDNRAGVMKEIIP